MKRDHWQRRIVQLDPEVEFGEIYRDHGRARVPVGLALYRTYAVPSIGGLLAETGEFERRTHKRYADTGLTLDAVVEHGFASGTPSARLHRRSTRNVPITGHTPTGALVRH